MANERVRAAARRRYIPISVGVQFFGSGQIGLCGIGQAGLWDVDGTGVCPVPSRDVAVVRPPAALCHPLFGGF